MLEGPATAGRLDSLTPRGWAVTFFFYSGYLCFLLEDPPNSRDDFSAPAVVSSSRYLTCTNKYPELLLTAGA